VLAAARAAPGGTRGLAPRQPAEARRDELRRRDGHVTSELLVAAARDHGTPVRQVIDVFHLEGDVGVRPHHADLLAEHRVAVHRVAVEDVRDRHDVDPSVRARSDAADGGGAEHLLDLALRELSEHGPSPL
jgi:hypothetical protein